MNFDRTPARRTLQGVATPGQVDVLHKPRAGDGERNRYIDHLTKLHGLGYISAEEHDRRVTVALHAQTMDALNGLIADLPGLTAPVSLFSREMMLHPNRRSVALLIISSVLSVAVTVVPGASLLAANLARTPLWLAALGFLSLTAGLVWSIANAVWWNRLWDNA